MPEEIFENPQPTEPNPTSWPKVVLVAVLGIGLLAAAAYTGYYYGTQEISKLKDQISKLQLKTQNQVTPAPTPTPAPVPAPEPTPTPSPPVEGETKDWKTYTNTKYGYSIKYPLEWFVESGTNVFKEGDLFSVKIVGKTQKEATEFYDGARLTIGVPIETGRDIKDWVKEYYPAKNVNDEPNEFSEEMINSLTFQKVYTCGLGCFTYHNIKNDGWVYRIMTFAGGPDEVKYKQTLLKILSTFKFLK